MRTSNVRWTGGEVELNCDSPKNSDSSSVPAIGWETHHAELFSVEPIPNCSTHGKHGDSGDEIQHKTLEEPEDPRCIHRMSHGFGLRLKSSRQSAQGVTEDAEVQNVRHDSSNDESAQDADFELGVECREEDHQQRKILLTDSLLVLLHVSPDLI